MCELEEGSFFDPGVSQEERSKDRQADRGGVKMNTGDWWATYWTVSLVLEVPCVSGERRGSRTETNTERLQHRSTNKGIESGRTN